jgi:hypothetical protein
MVRAEQKRRGETSRDRARQQALMAPYSDNAFAICWNSVIAKDVYTHMMAEFVRRCFILREDIIGESAVEHFGLSLAGGETCRFTNKSSRVWKIHAGIMFALSQSTNSGYMILILIGHFISAFMVQRGMLASFSCVWEFIEKYGPNKCSFADCSPQRVVHRCPHGLTGRTQSG